MGTLPQAKHLPVIDLRLEHLNSTSSTWVTTCGEVMRALEEYGCFIAMYDGVSQGLHDAIFHASQQLFDLPTEVKALDTAYPPSHGYIGARPGAPFYEGLGIQNATTKQGIERFEKLMWPSGNPSFSEGVLEYSKAVAELEHLVMRIIAKSYGIEENYESLLGSKTYLVRLMKYIIPQVKENESIIGIYAHTDKTFTSLLDQYQVKGLEIKAKDGEWIEVNPLPSSFVFMAGDVCTAWTNGRIESPVHRVMMHGDKERYSVGIYAFIRDRKIEVPQQLVDEDHPLQYKPFYNCKLIDYFNTDEGKKSKYPLKSFCGI
ncbi:oxoglutarate/iron-dependent dioxygenase [Artemisia annua]|uniref:Oxoglutarate/iron-dependent dioxygenase n=1 Tax=Artemisia annua TaxID=35608 RepID=A0A2U1NIH9_ARTAN|nr:oxoglutarate/iron-dependent dioxygenase [Artemisia annua]